MDWDLGECRREMSPKVTTADKLADLHALFYIDILNTFFLSFFNNLYYKFNL